MYIWASVHICLCVCVFVYMYIYVRMHVCVCVLMHVYVCMGVCMYVCICIYIQYVCLERPACETEMSVQRSCGSRLALIWDWYRCSLHSSLGSVYPDGRPYPDTHSLFLVWINRWNHRVNLIWGGTVVLSQFIMASEPFLWMIYPITTSKSGLGWRLVVYNLVIITLLHLWPSVDVSPSQNARGGPNLICITVKIKIIIKS